MACLKSLNQLIELISNVTDAFTTALFVADPEQRMLTLAGFHSLSLNLDEKARIAYGDGPIGWVAENEKPYLEEFSSGTSSALKLYKKKEDLKDLLAVPVIEDELLGVLVVDSKESYRFTARSQKLVSGFADQIAGYLVRQKSPADDSHNDFFPYYDLLQYNQSIAGSLHPQAMAENMLSIPTSILQCDAKAVIWLEDDKPVGKVISQEGWGQDLKQVLVEPGKGIAGSCMKSSMPILSSNLDKHHSVIFRENEDIDHFGIVLAVPLVFKGHLLAILVCACREAEGLGATHLRRMNLVSAMMAPALFYAREKRNWDYNKNLDQVTRIPNYRCLAEYREKIEKEVFVGTRPVFLLSVFLKNLQGIYETYGVSVGDGLLNQVVSMLAKVIPSPKFLFKYSDTTLLVLVLNTKHPEVESLEARLKKVFEKTPFYVDRQSLLVKADLGLSIFPEEGSNLGELACLSWARASQPPKAAHDH